jgi:hypothetical protein
LAQGKSAVGEFHFAPVALQHARRLIEQTLTQLVAGLHDRVARDVSHAARSHAAVARRTVRVTDHHAHLIDRNSHLVGDQLAQDRVRARALIDARTENREAAVGVGA